MPDLPLGLNAYIAPDLPLGSMPIYCCMECQSNIRRLNAYANANSNVNVSANAHANAHVNAHANAYANAYANLYPHAHMNTDNYILVMQVWTLWI